MNATTAQVYAQKLVQREARGAGDIDNALDRLESRYGIGRWQLSHLRKGNAKTVEAGLFQRLQNAFIDHCGKQAKQLLHEAEIAQQTGKTNENIARIEGEIAALVAQLEAAKRS